MNVDTTDPTIAAVNQPIVVFALQSPLLHDRPMPLAYSAVATSAVYLAPAWWPQRRRAASQTLLVEALIAIGVAPNDIYFKIGLVTVIGLAAKNAILIVEFAIAGQAERKTLYDAVPHLSTPPADPKTAADRRYAGPAMQKSR
jgi:hypothetical protein